MAWRGTAPVDWLVVGLGNPGSQYAGTPHNVGFEVAEALVDRWDLGKPKKKFQGLLAEGRAGIGGPRVAVLLPQTYMNDAGRAVGPARGAYKVDLDRVVVLHDEIELPLDDIRVQLRAPPARRAAARAGPRGAAAEGGGGGGGGAPAGAFPPPGVGLRVGRPD